jgi:hypothetical protein
MHPAADLDRAILTTLADGHWRKVAYVIGAIRLKSGATVDAIHSRICSMVALGQLQATGDYEQLDQMGNSEVRTAQAQS